MTSVLETPSVAVARAWNTWSADNYLEMIFKPLGVRVTPIVYSAAISTARTIGPGAEVTLGPHATDGSHVEISFDHAGTKLDWLWHRGTDPYALEGSWRTPRARRMGPALLGRARALLRPGRPVALSIR